MIVQNKDNMVKSEKITYFLKAKEEMYNNTKQIVSYIILIVHLFSLQ